MARHAAHAVIGSEDKILRVRDGSTWIDVPGVNDWTISGGEREGRSTTSDSGSPSGLAGPKSAPQIECAAYGVPGHRACEVILDAFQANTELRFQMETPEQTLLATTTGSNNAAITTGGAVSFTGASRPTLDDLRLGSLIRIGTNDYVIATVNPSTLATTVNPAPSANVAAGNYGIRTPRLLREFAAKVLSTPDHHGSIAQSGELQGTLRLQLRGELPEWAVQAPA